jgi:bacterioferritin-associated ferredoxin
MVICHCLAVNDRMITELAGRGPVSVDDVVAMCGAGGRCGGCRHSIERVLANVDPVGRTEVRSAR